MRNGEVYVIGANQGAGKTSLALQFGLAALHAGHGVLLLSMEMVGAAVFQRLVGIEAQVDLALFREAQRLQTEKRRRAISIGSCDFGDFAGANCWFPTKPAVTPEYIVFRNQATRQAQSRFRS